MTPQLLILFGLFLTLSSTAAICVIILIERRRAHRVRVNAIKDLVVSHVIRK